MSGNKSSVEGTVMPFMPLLHTAFAEAPSTLKGTGGFELGLVRLVASIEEELRLEPLELGGDRASLRCDMFGS